MKLVRDKIPTIIEKSGNKCVYRVASAEEYKASLYEKLREELDEFIETPCYEEAADMYEVFHAICEYHNMHMLKVEVEAVDKRKKKGGFKERFILESVTSEDNTNSDPWEGFESIPSGF
jgi:predicted house-cleaning noncanonical NTP pyrophosphatase (MazG superfamily)